jgi:RNA polymerase sigma factor (sigma-70 family)
MQPRQDIVKLFSTFIQFDLDRFNGWATDPRLRRSMKQCLDKVAESEIAENFWALYWHKIWQEQPQSLSSQHLTAYLQEVCFWAAQKTISGFTSTQYGVADCFQAAIVKIDKVLKGFDSDRGYNLKSYASITFGNLIRELLRQKQEIDISSEWSLLRKISQKRSIESLENAGIDPKTIESCILAWNCFRQIYVPERANATRQLKKPDEATWNAIVKLYNEERHGKLIEPGKPATPQTIEAALLLCARAARAYFNPTVTSLNQSKPGYDGGEILNDIVGEVDDSLLTEMIAAEEVDRRTQQHGDLDRILNEAINSLSQDEQKLLELYYQQGLKQAQIAQELNTQQYNISRKLAKTRNYLLKALARWSESSLHISLTSDILKGISALLEEWLFGHYNNHSNL